jgi:hypothetical protein
MADTQVDLSVGIGARVVPDGFDITGQHLRLSLVLRPDPDLNNGGTRVHLDTWPSDVESVLRSAIASSNSAVIIEINLDQGGSQRIILDGDSLRSALKSSP